MQCFKKMKFVSLLVALMMVLGLVPLIAPQAASAAPSFSSLSSMSSMYFYLSQDTAGLGQVKADLAALQGLTPSATLEGQLFGPSGYLPLPSTSMVTEAAATRFLIDLEQIKYSSDAGTAISSALNFYNMDATTEGNLLPGVTVGDFISFATNVQTTGLESALSSPSNYATVQSGSLSAGFISTALTSAMTTAAAGTTIPAAVTANGWSFANITAAEMLIDSQVDPTYLGDAALFKAYVNSNTPISSSSTPVSITVPAGGSGSIDLNSLPGGDTGVLPAITINSAVYGATSTVTIQQGTTVTASGGTWDGIISLPTVVTPPASELPAGAGSVVAISLGPDTNVTLTFSKPVSILLPGQTGKSAGYIKNGKFTQITDKLTSNALPSGAADGYYDDGINITIWTTHFTTFLTYSPTAIAQGGGAPVPAPVTSAPVTPAPVTPVTPVTPAPVTPVTPVPAPPSVKGVIFTDVLSTYWGYGAIESLSGLGMVSGYPDGTFRPEASITRAEFVDMLVKALAPVPNTGTTFQFTDVSPDAWYYNAVNAAASAGLTVGENSRLFDPNAPITREQMGVMVAKALGVGNKAPITNGTELNPFSDKSLVSEWAMTGMGEAVKAGVISGITADTLAPLDNASRAQGAEMIYKMLPILGK